MNALRTFLLLGVCLVGLYLRFAPSSFHDESGHNSVRAPAENSAVGGIPEKAYQVLSVVRTTGHAPEGYVGGRIFQNREGRLPNDGSYREFDVDPHQGGRNAERIIVEWQTKKAWYTGDHYQTFVPLP